MGTLGSPGRSPDRQINRWRLYSKLFPTPEERWDLVQMLQRPPADAETFLLPVSPVSVSQTQETPRQTTQSIDTPQSIATPQSMEVTYGDLPQRGESVDSAVSFIGGPASAFLSGADGYAYFAGEVAVVVTSLAVLAGDVAVRVALPAVAGAASPADLAKVVALDVTCLAAAGMVTIGVTDLADAKAASLADAGMAFPVDHAGVVTIAVASLADAGMVTVGVTDLADARAASLADAGMALPADFAGVITVGVAPLLGRRPWLTLLVMLPAG